MARVLATINMDVRVSLATRRADRVGKKSSVGDNITPASSATVVIRRGLMVVSAKMAGTPSSSDGFGQLLHGLGAGLLFGADANQGTGHL